MGEEIDFDKKKAHAHRHAGRKAEKKKAKNKHEQELTDKQRNPKAFAFKSAVKAHQQFLRTQDFKAKKHHIPVVDRTPLDPPPVIVSIVGGPKSGKSTLLRSLIKNFTRQKLSVIQGPVTVVVGKKRRLTFIEVNNDVNSMIDIAKVSDIVLMLIDATFGIEMEVFEFLEICRAHGTPRVMGILNHLDLMKDNKALNKKKKVLKHRFQVELYPGAKLFYLSGIIHGEYLKKEVENMSRFIMVMKFRPLTWRTTHPYVLVDRYEDITNPENLRTNPKCDRDVVLYGYVRGVPFQKSQMVHIPGCGDYKMKDISYLHDPCPLPGTVKQRSLNAKERVLFAPMSGVGGVLYDKDAVYIDLGGSHHGVRKQKNDYDDDDENETGLQPLLDLQKTADEKQAQSKIQIYSHGEFISGEEATEKSSNDEVENSEDYDQNERKLEGEKEKKEEHDAEEEENDVEEAIKERRMALPEYESITSTDGVTRRRVIFSDHLEDDDDDKDEEETEDENSQEEEEDDEVEQEYAPAPSKKKMKYTSDENSLDGSNTDDSDMDDDNVDKDVMNLLQPDNDRSQNKKTHKNKDSDIQRTCVLKNNKDSNVTSMIQGILENIKTPNHKKPPRSFLGDEKNSQMDINGSLESDEKAGESGEEEARESGDEDESEQENEEQTEQMSHRTDMFREAVDNFYKNQSTVSYLRKSIYGNLKEDDESSSDEDEDGMGGLFQKSHKTQKKEGYNQSNRAMLDDVDTSRYLPHGMRDWRESELLNSIRDCFVTGQWKESENAETLLKMDDEDDDLYGDFEDVETGEKFTATDKDKKENQNNGDEMDEAVVPVVEPKKVEMTAKEKRIEKKRKLKALFDSEYDENGEGEYFEALKNELNEQAELNRTEFDGLDDETRVQYEGYRSGMYVRMEFEQFPCEFITNFDPSYPVIVGGLLENESNMGFVRVRIKVHRWYPKILKNRDPLILSLGWRRFQSMMYYAKREDNFRMRSLKYARKFLHIEAMFWGPITPVSTGFVALQNITDRVPDFRIAANGVVLEADKSTKIVKKLKLIGAPEKILKKTAFIKDMFHSETEIAKFIGAQIQTQSGIRGIIKKSKGLDGLFRATFEDKIKMSDVIILKTWAPVELARHCFCVKTLLLPPNAKAAWQGMKTVSQIKKERSIMNDPNHDSMYTPITERSEYIKHPLKIPRKLQAALPYACKPKFTPTTKKADRVVVVKDPDEVKMDEFMMRLKTMMDDKIEKAMQKKTMQKLKYKKEDKLRKQSRKIREKRRKSEACRKLSKKGGGRNKNMV